MSSKVGQQYVCHYKLTPSKPEESVKQDPAEINITDLLEPMRGYCLTKVSSVIDGVEFMLIGYIYFYAYRLCLFLGLLKIHSL